MKKIYFTFGLHNHQPVGNFEHVFHWACENAYLPFFEVLKEYPHIKLTLHYSGILLSWIKKNYPALLENIISMVNRGQVEIMTGGFYEPILPFLPDRDKIGQIEKLTKFIKENIGCQPKGMWLAERIWDQNLVKVLVKTGIEYVVVDDTHFKMAGLYDADLGGYYTTEQEGETLKVFPINKKLRYMIPFAMPDDILDYFKSRADRNGSLLVMADDGEKFGVWPETFKHVYQDKWLRNFFNMLEKNKKWLISTTFSQYLKSHKSKGRIYLPLASYEEMMKWSLLPSAQMELEDLEEKIKHLPDAEQWRRFIKGGLWWNFFTKYPESNNMHKKMLYVSNKVDKMKNIVEKRKDTTAKLHLEEAYDELWQGQCNCSYWHGVFGGLYLGHLRNAIYEHLIKSEKITDLYFYSTEKFWQEVERIDFNADGEEEILISNPVFNFYFDLNKGGSLFELDYKPKNVNIINTLKRTKETYHRRLLDNTDNQKEVSSHQPASIHNLVKEKEKGLKDYLVYDWYSRSSLLDHFLHPDTDLNGFKKCHYGEQGDFINQPYFSHVKKEKNKTILCLEREGNVWADDSSVPVCVKKIITFHQEGMLINYEIVNLGKKSICVWFAPEFNFSFSNPYDSLCHYYIPGITLENNLFSFSDITPETSRFGMRDKYHGLDINMIFNLPCSVWYFPIETVSLSEGGLEKGYQESVVLPNWKIKLKNNQPFKIEINKLIKTYEDSTVDAFN
ncbi:DUF1926 domain-containing protein [bacterium]|nr:DUF1926 domain-containing protein [bacterium]